MKFKVLLLTMILIVSASLSAFAVTPQELVVPQNLQNQFSHTMIAKLSNGLYWVLCSNSPIYVNPSTNTIVAPSNMQRYQYDMNTPSTYFAMDMGTISGLSETFITSIYKSNYDYMKGTTVLFQAPRIHPIQEGMEGAKNRLLSQILVILPIILGGIVLFLGLRKALQMLFRSLAKA